ncbi:MAG: 4-(cytidine 5'-diphospho)-2-C-methyl-D-erythritol kinase [bacterium]|nr:4-(cytidine 5'-diphospho)-2-C-methyl-D-erythritol kinase [bacterium]
MKLERAGVIRTPAKVNLHLYVQHRRPDGYHELELDLIPISLYDTLEFLPFEQEGLWFLSEPELCEPQHNLVVRAIKALEDEVSARFQMAVKLTKQIPHGAGLGGGSGNAAGALVALNQLLNLKIPPQRLFEIARSLGADVPFFLDPRPQQARGIGEQFCALEIQGDWSLLLVKPDLSISTKEAYQLAQHSARKLPPGPYPPSLIKQLQPQGNDFFEPLKAKYPALKQIELVLQKTGAPAVLLSGSGSCVFGIYPEAALRDAAFESVDRLFLGELFKAEFLSHHDYAQDLENQSP